MCESLSSPTLAAELVLRYATAFSGLHLEYGGLIYWNQLASTNVAEVSNFASYVATCSAPAMQKIDWSLQNNLLRPKAIRQPLEY